MKKPTTEDIQQSFFLLCGLSIRLKEKLSDGATDKLKLNLTTPQYYCSQCPRCWIFLLLYWLAWSASSIFCYKCWTYSCRITCELLPGFRFHIHSRSILKQVDWTHQAYRPAGRQPVLLTLVLVAPTLWQCCWELQGKPKCIHVNVSDTETKHTLHEVDCIFRGT